MIKLFFPIRKSLLIILFISLVQFSFSQENSNKWRTIPSLTDWIEEINNTTDSIYEVKNIRILIDIKKDALLIDEMTIQHDSISENIAAIINKNVTIDGLEFVNSFGVAGEVKLIKNIQFKGWVRISNYTSNPITGFTFKNMIFNKRFTLTRSDKFGYFNFIDCKFKTWVGFFDFNESGLFSFTNVQIDDHIQLTRCSGKPFVIITNSNFNEIGFQSESISELEIRNSTINKMSINDAIIVSKLHIVESTIEMIELSGAQLPENNTYIPFNQVSGKFFAQPFNFNRLNPTPYIVSDSMDFGLKEDYDLLISSYKTLLGTYQKRGDLDSYNNCYIEMKDIETRRLEFLHTKTPTFKGFFTWKINQFLKVFSAYGTEPAKAVIFSMYVILLFAFIYLLFPNSWDSHGKKRLMHRFEFFQKYLRRKDGIHTLYLEDKHEEISSYEDFKTNLENSKTELPSFFVSWSKPLYNASMFSSKLIAHFLKSTDVLKGKWQDLSPKQKRWKNIQIGFLLIVGLCYDLFIKILNALMLSINTFTTLGFGEIPIKGLPRYLAIIQGFIGWFMLTIFSVSLISQLLN